MTTTTTATTSTTTTTTTSTTTTTTTSTTAAREKEIANGFYSSTVSTVSFSEMKNLFVSRRVSFSSFRINREKFQPKASKGFKQLRVTRHLRMLGFLIVTAGHCRTVPTLTIPLHCWKVFSASLSITLCDAISADSANKIKAAISLWAPLT